MKKFSIVERWHSFARAILAPNTGEQQYIDMKVSFLAGAFSCFAIMEKTGALDQDEALIRIQKLKDEIDGAIMPGGYDRGGKVARKIKTAIEDSILKEYFTENTPES